MNANEPQPQTVEMPLLTVPVTVFPPSVHVVPIEQLPKVQPHHIRQVVIFPPTIENPNSYLLEVHTRDEGVRVGSALTMQHALDWLGEVFRDILE